MRARLIEAHALIESVYLLYALNGWDPVEVHFSARDIEENIKAAPEWTIEATARPFEIVHCKDCEWWTKAEASPQGRCALLRMYPAGGWFCGNGQRKENDTEGA